MLIVQHMESFSNTCVVSSPDIVLYQVLSMSSCIEVDACTVILCCIKIGILCCINIGFLCCINTVDLCCIKSKLVLYQVNDSHR